MRAFFVDVTARCRPVRRIGRREKDPVRAGVLMPGARDCIRPRPTNRIRQALPTLARQRRIRCQESVKKALILLAHRRPLYVRMPLVE